MNRSLFTALSGVCIAAASLHAQTKVVMLGTGTPNDDPDRSGPAVAIVVHGETYLVDAGPGVVRRAALARQRDSLPALAAPKPGWRGDWRLNLAQIQTPFTSSTPTV